MIVRMISVVFTIALWATAAYAQATTEPDALKRYLEAVSQAVESPDGEAFAALVGNSALRHHHRANHEDNVPILSAGYRVIEQSSEQALVIFGLEIAPQRLGKGPISESGIQSILASGVYEVLKQDSGWKIGAKQPFNLGHRLLHHDVMVDVKPGVGVTVRDAVRVNIDNSRGLALALHPAAQIQNVSESGDTCNYAQLGAVLWIDPGTTGEHTIVIEYELPVKANAESQNSAYFGKQSGHLRTQNGWIPSFFYDDALGTASFDVSVTAPASYHVATDLVQRVEMTDSEIQITAASATDTIGFNVLYDTRWEPRSIPGTPRLDIYASPDFEPSAKKIQKEFEYVTAFLAERFGPPTIEAFAVIQAANRADTGWLSYENQAIMAGRNGGKFAVYHDRARAFFAHEVSHVWTTPTGPASNLLREGWASYFETLNLEDRYGPDAAALMLERYARFYFGLEEKGAPSLLNDRRNSGVSYTKGAWLFAMLERQYGRKDFHQALRRFMTREFGPHTLESFLAALRTALDAEAASFARQWIETRVAPRLAVKVRDNAAYLVQRQDTPYDLTVDVAGRNAQGNEVVRKTVSLDDSEARIDISAESLEAIDGFLIDPDRKLLLRRHLPETHTGD